MKQIPLADLEQWRTTPSKPLPQITPSVGPITPIEPSETPSPESRAFSEYGLGEFTGQMLRKGAADIIQTVLMPFRATKEVFGPEYAFELEPVATRISKAIPSLFGIRDIGDREDVVQRAFGGGVRALPFAAIPGPRGASIATRSPTAASEATLTTFGSGAGFELGRTAGEGTAFETPLGIAAALTAGSATSALHSVLTSAPGFAAKQVRNLNSKVRDAVGEENFNKLVNTSTAQQLDRILRENPDLLDKLSRVDELKEFIPGFNPNLFQATEASTVAIRGQAALERQVNEIPEIRAQQATSQEAVRMKTAELFPTTESSFAFAGQKLNKSQTAIASVIQYADNKIADLTSQFVKSGKQDLGKQIRSAYEGRRVAVKQIFNDQYSALDQKAASLGVQLDPQQTQSLYNTVLSNREVFENSPELFSLVQTRLAPKDRQVDEAPSLVSPEGVPFRQQAQPTQEFPTLSFEDLRSLSRRLNSDFYAAAQASTRLVPDAGRKAAVLGQLKQQVDTAIESLPENIRTDFKALNTAYDDQYREVFRKGLGGIVGQKTRMGERILDEDIIGKLTKETHVDDFYSIFGDTPETQEFLKNGLIEKFLNQDNSLTSGGLINQGALNSFARKNEGVISKVPSLQQFLSNAQENIAVFAAQKQAAIEGKQALERSALAAISKKQNLDEVFKAGETGAFQNLSKLSELIAASKADKTGRAAKGIQGLMMEKALDSADPVAFVKKNERAFKQSFGNDFETVMKLTEASRMVGREFQLSPPVRVLEGDLLQQKTGSGIPQIFSLLRDRITSVSTKASILFSRFTQAKGLEAQDKAFLEIFKNPSYARDALKHTRVLGSPISSEEAKQKAFAGLNKVFVKAGVNMYRTAGVGITGEVGRAAEGQQQQEQAATQSTKQIENIGF
jgi:hypothetical protein